MAEITDPNPEQKGMVQQIVDKVKDVAGEMAEDVQETISDVRNSEIGGKVSEVAQNVGGKVSEVAQNVGEKVKDVVQDVKDSEFVDKVGDVAKDLLRRAKAFGGMVLERLGTFAGLPTLQDAGKKFRESAEDTTEKEKQLDELDKMVAVILEDGVITPEEEAMLAKRAEEIGLDVEAFLAEVRQRCAPKE